MILYDTHVLANLADNHPDKRLIVEYREPNGDRMRGELLTAYISLAGNHCAQVGSFANWVYCDDIINIKIED